MTMLPPWLRDVSADRSIFWVIKVLCGPREEHLSRTVFCLLHAPLSLHMMKCFTDSQSQTASISKQRQRKLTEDTKNFSYFVLVFFLYKSFLSPFSMWPKLVMIITYMLYKVRATRVMMAWIKKWTYNEHEVWLHSEILNYSCISSHLQRKQVKQNIPVVISCIQHLSTAMLILLL